MALSKSDNQTQDPCGTKEIISIRLYKKTNRYSKMKRQNLGYDLYTPQQPPQADWYILPIALVVGVLAVGAFVGVENVFNVLVTFFTSI